MNPLIQCKTTILPLLAAGVLACFELLPKAEAVVPAPDGGYPGGNTAEGQDALFSLTSGTYTTRRLVFFRSGATPVAHLIRLLEPERSLPTLETVIQPLARAHF